MITILYDRDTELDNLIDFIRCTTFCVDFSDTCKDCDSPGACDRCRTALIETCLMDRETYHDINPFLQAIPKSCNTCANAPICWLSTTAAAPDPCAHYIPVRAKKESKEV